MIDATHGPTRRHFYFVFVFCAYFCFSFRVVNANGTRLLSFSASAVDCQCTDVTVGKEVPFDILTSAAGPGQSQVNITSPTGRPVPCSLTPVAVGTNAKFVPTEAGPHSVQVTFNDQPVSGSPFTTVATQVSRRVDTTHRAIRVVGAE